MNWDLETALALLTLTSLEVVLGIDNIIFISILTSRLPQESQEKARKTGLLLAMLIRVLLLMSLSWIMKLTLPLFTILGEEISGRDLILIIGGIFLIAKSTTEIHHKIEGSGNSATGNTELKSFGKVIVQILILDIIFSLDSVITAIGMTDKLIVMITAVVLSVIFMLIASGTISEFVDTRPTIKILALSFLILIGMALLGEGLDLHIPKGYIYFAMSFSFVVELLNLKLRNNT